ncbi:MAG: thermonuclease family protein [candidate division Zixibacteria bacterium]
MGRQSNKKSRRVYRWLAVIVLAIIILNIRLVEDIGFDRKPSDRFTVVAIIDGDTVELTGGDRLRLLCIDTPEEGEPYYEEAKSFLVQTVLGKQARIEFAAVRRDRYGRLLGYLYIDSLLINEEIVERGLGNVYLFRDTDMGRIETLRILQAQRQAMSERLGIWSVEREPEAYYVAGNDSYRFHRPGCRSAANFQEGKFRRFKTRDEAMSRGLSPCRNCRP